MPQIIAFDQVGTDVPPVVRGVGRAIRRPAVIADDLDEPGVLHAVALGRGPRPEHPPVEGEIGGESHGGVGARRAAHLLHGPLGGGTSEQVDRQLAEHLLEIVVVEAFRQGRQHGGGHLVVPGFVGEPRGEQVPPMVGPVPAPDGQGPGAIGDDQVRAGAEQRRGEADGGQVAFADLPQTDHHAELSRAQTGLVGMGDHRGIAHRRGLDGVLVAEVGAHEEAGPRGQVDVARDAMADQVVVMGERRFEVVVPTAESPQCHLKHLGRLVVVKKHDAVDQGCGPGTGERGVLAGHEEFDDHSSRVGSERRAEPCGEVSAGHGSRLACCMVEISAMVDSAPWLRFGPCSVRPS
ncbi:hypothetical protein ACFQE7_44370 [Nonomuraea ferruginea]|uniref:hypothetical protein n=1 Tax=Nonomuraea ferruginea TaxID=46174 RepID=UPI003612F5B2